jgi:RimJ/RimL family protein N-acetyltransferase
MLVNLLPLSEEYIELIRNWRNQDHIREMMEYNEVISAAEQLTWFHNLDKQKNKYFLIATNDEFVGLTHLKNCTDESAEAGLFIGNKKYLGTGIAFYASISILDLSFYELGLSKVDAKVKRTNLDAIRYNSTLGFKEQSILNEDFLLMTISKENYLERRANLINTLGTR